MSLLAVCLPGSFLSRFLVGSIFFFPIAELKSIPERKSMSFVRKMIIAFMVVAEARAVITAGIDAIRIINKNAL